MSEQRVVIDGDLRVQGNDDPVLQQAQGVDLNQGRVGGCHHLIHLAKYGRRALLRFGGKVACQIPHLIILDPQNRIDLRPPDGGRAFAGDLLDVHPALGRHHGQIPGGRAVERDRRVELLRDVDQPFDQDPRDRRAREPLTQDPAGGVLGLPGALHQGHASALSPAADLDLGLHRDPPSESFGHATGLFR